MIEIRLNGENTTIADNCSLAELVAKKGYQAGYYAVAVNRQVVPPGQHADILLRAGDRVEIVRAMPGG